MHNLIGNQHEALETIDSVQRGIMKPKVRVRSFKELPNSYKELGRSRRTYRIESRHRGELPVEKSGHEMTISAEYKVKDCALVPSQRWGILVP